MGTKSTSYRKRRTGVTSYVSPGHSEIYTSSRLLSYTNHVTTGDSPSDWKWRISQGLDATSTLNGLRYSISRYKPVTSVIEYNDGTKASNVGYPTSGHLPQFAGPVYSPTTKASIEAEQNFAKSYRKITRQMQGGVFLAEIAETARLLRNPVKSMFSLTSDFVNHLKRGKRLPFRRYREFLGDAWLTYSFGMKPLASDANDYATALNALSSGRNFELARCYGTGSSEEMTTIGYIASATMIPGGGTWEQEREDSRSCSVSIRGAVKIRGEIPPCQRFGLSALDIVPTVWEAIPFSFLVDYFTNIGDTLDASMLRFVDFSWLNQTVRNRTRVTMKDARPYAPDASMKRRYAYGGGAIFDTRTVTRSSRDNNFGGQFQFTSPGLGSMKWLNISALVSSIGLSKPIGNRF